MGRRLVGSIFSTILRDAGSGLMSSVPSSVKWGRSVSLPRVAQETTRGHVCEGARSPQGHVCVTGISADGDWL